MGDLEIAQKDIEGSRRQMMAYADDFEMTQNSNQSVII